MWTEDISDYYIKKLQDNVELCYEGFDLGINKDYFSIDTFIQTYAMPLNIEKETISYPSTVLPSCINTFWGDAYYKKDINYYKIISDFTKLINKNSTASKYYSDIADFYFYILYTEDRDSIWLEYAENDYSTAIKLEPDNYSYYCKRGIFYYFNEQYEKAVADLTKSINISTTAMAICYRAFCYEVLNNIESACEDYINIIESNDTSKQQYIEIARESINYEDLKNYSAHIFYKKGQNYLKENKFDLAISDFEEALKITNHKQYENALLEAKKLKKNLDKYAELYNLGFEYYYDGDYENAEECISKALEIQPQNCLCVDLLNNIKKQLVDIAKCTKWAILTLDGFNEEKANNFIKLRAEGVKWYDLDSFVEQFELMPIEKKQIQGRVIFPLRQGAKLGRRIEF